MASVMPTLIAFFFVIQLLFIQNFIFGPSLFFFYNIDGVIFYHLILVLLSNIILLLIGFMSQSKYSLLGIFRAIVQIVSMDIFITVTYVLLVLNSNSGNFHDFSITQATVYYIIIFSPLSFIFLIIMLLESKRAPFDHTETESEVVAGYAVEYSGIYLLTFYLVEYFHLIISANHFTICFLGG
jgi:NADH:ubiquinone oxidoreductase subunit H